MEMLIHSRSVAADVDTKPKPLAGYVVRKASSISAQLSADAITSTGDADAPFGVNVGNTVTRKYHVFQHRGIYGVPGR